MVIYVPKGEEVSPSTETLVADSQVTESAVSESSGRHSDGDNINTADTTLQTLSGIEKRALISLITGDERSI